MKSQVPFSLVPNEFAAKAKAYSVPKGDVPPRLVLDANEGRFPFPAWTSLVADSEINRYPSREKLTKALARYHNIDEQQVVVTAGGDDAIDRACRAMLSCGRELIFPTPSFDVILAIARPTGVTVREVPWLTADYPVESVCEKINSHTAMISVISPNNPTGGVITSAELEILSRRAPQALLLVDLAYIEFADEDLTQVALSLPNAVVIRTFSKARGLAGMRIGYALGPAPVISWMNALGHPYPTSQISLSLAEISITQGEPEMQSFVKQCREDRARFEEFFEANGFEYRPSQGNFVFVRLSNAHRAWDALAAAGIAVRRFAPSEDIHRKDLSNWLRISCPADPQDREEVISLLQQYR